MVRKIKKEDGFTLVELSISLIILGILFSVGLVIITGLLRQKTERSTFEKMERVADAITLYAQQNFRVPCPANPIAPVTGVEQALGVNGACTGVNVSGIVPFADLGLSEKDAKDHFGNFLTYRVSPSAANFIPGNFDVNQWCMTRPLWHIDTNFDGVTDTYVNPEKARFCCGSNIANFDPAQDIIMNGPNGPLTDIMRDDPGGANPPGVAVSGAYITMANNPPGIGPLTNTFVPIFPAYVLISHGENGFGALPNNPAPATAQEIENADGDRNFFVTDRISPVIGTTTLFRQQIDDIVFWETPAQVMTRLGEVSCTRP